LNNSDKNWRRVSLYAPLFIWIGVIFFLSGFGGSLDNTSRFIGPLLRFFFPDASPETLAFYHFFIRKAAHFTAYAILALLAYRAFVSLRRRAWISLVVVALVAALDETNQAFNPSRSGALTDVFLDLSGGVAALIGVYVFARRGAKSRERAPRESTRG